MLLLYTGIINTIGWLFSLQFYVKFVYTSILQYTKKSLHSF